MSPEDVATRTALRQRYLETHITTQSQYLARLNRLTLRTALKNVHGVWAILVKGNLELP